MFKKFVVAASLSASLLMGGCASVPMASPEADAKAKTFAVPTDGTANLYIYRNESFGSAIKMPLLLDGMTIGDTGPHTYVLKQVSAGKHTVVSKTENDATLDIDAISGRNYFVWQEVKMGAFSAGSALHQVDESEGTEAVKDCKLIQ